MYDWPELHAANDRLWAGIAAQLHERGVSAPNQLLREGRIWDHWQSPDLLLSQTCGFPYRTKLHASVTLVGTPDYGLDDAAPGYYYSVLVVAADQPGDWRDFVTRTLAINGFDSQSGFAAPLNFAHAHGLHFSDFLATGSHRESARAVAEGRADIAAIDAVTWRLITAHAPKVAARLRVAARTDATPGLPLITSPGHDAALLAGAVRTAITQMSPADKDLTGLRGLCAIAPEAYRAVPLPG